MRPLMLKNTDLAGKEGLVLFHGYDDVNMRTVR